MAIKTIEVCLLPSEFEHRPTSGEEIIVINDVLRASTSMITAFHFGLERIIPIAELDEARKYKEEGFLVAAERNGIKSHFADFGNSPFEFMNDEIRDKTLVYSSTNGTQAIEKAKSSGLVAIGAFINLEALALWIISVNKNVVIYCSGWKNTCSLEDSLFAGALTECLIKKQNYSMSFDSTQIALELWKVAKPNLNNYIRKAAHYQRLKKLNAVDIMEYALKINSTNAIPVLKGNYFINIADR